MISEASFSAHSPRERAHVESLAILLESHHDNPEARYRHCREAAGLLRSLFERLQRAEAEAAGLRAGTALKMFEAGVHSVRAADLRKTAVRYATAC